MTGAEEQPHVAAISTWILLAYTVDAALGYGFWSVAAHRTSPANIGAAAGFMAVVAAICSLTGAGPGLAMIEWVARLDIGARRGLVVATATATLAAVILSVVLVAASSALTNAAGMARLASPAAGIPVATLVWQCHVQLDQVFVAMVRTPVVLIRAVVFGTGKVATLALLMAAGIPAHAAILLSWYGAAVVVTVVSLAILKPLISTTTVQPAAATPLSGLLRSAAAHHLSILPPVVTGALIPVLVATHTSAPRFAYFSLSWAIANGILLIHSAGSLGLYTASVRQKAPGQASRVTRSAHLFVGLLNIVVVGAVAITFRPLLGLLGHTYAQVMYPLVLLFAIAALPASITYLATARWRAQRRLRLVTGFNLCYDIAILAGTATLLPVVDIYAVVWAQLVARVLGAAVAIVINYRSRTSPTTPAVPS